MYISRKFSKLSKKPSWKASHRRDTFPLLANVFLLISTATGSVAANLSEIAESSRPNIIKAKNSDKAKILAKDILAAYGGEDKFKQVYEKGCHGLGKYTQISALSGAANTFNIEIFNKGDKIREEMSVLGEPLVGGFDGKHSWLKQYGEVIEDNPAGQDQTRQEIEHGLQVLLKLCDKNTGLEYIGSDKSTIYDLLKVTTPEGISTYLYADKKTHLIAKTEFVGIDEEQGLPMTKSFRYSDYRSFSGTMIPFKMSEYCGDKKASETSLGSIKEELLSDSLFQVPKANAPLLAKDRSVTIPFELLSGEIFIDVSINGKPGYVFVVDTGATQTLIDTSVAPQLGITKQSDLSITTGAGSVPMSYMRLKSLGVGVLTFNEIPAAVADLSPLKKAAPNKNVAGMLGANIMRQFLTTFDFPNKLITFANPDSKLDGYYVVTTLPAKPSLGGAGLMVEGRLDGKKLDCLIDTGAAYSVIPYELAKQIGDKSTLGENVVHGLDGKPVKVADGKFYALKLGSESIYHPNFLVAFEKTKSLGMIGNGSVAILGNPTWRHYCLTLDYKGQKVVLSHKIKNTK